MESTPKSIRDLDIVKKVHEIYEAGRMEGDMKINHLRFRGDTFCFTVNTVKGSLFSNITTTIKLSNDGFKMYIPHWYVTDKYLFIYNSQKRSNLTLDWGSEGDVIYDERDSNEFLNFILFMRKNKHNNDSCIMQ
jgi:hypothetical protein